MANTTVVGLFDDHDQAERAIRDLMDAGFTRDEMSIVAADPQGTAREHHVDEGGNLAAGGAVSGATSGAVVGGVIGLLVGLGTLAFPAIGLVAAGPIAGLVTGVGIGAVSGGLIGALVGMGIPKEDAEIYAEKVNQGATLVTIQAAPARAQKAFEILDRDGAHDVDRRIEQARQEVADRNIAPEERTRFDANQDALQAPYGQRVRTYSGTLEQSDTNALGAPTEGMNMAAEGTTAEATTGMPANTSNSRGPGGQDIASQPFDAYEDDFKKHMAAQGNTEYEIYRPAYRYGYELGNHPDYAARPWTDVERQFRGEWEKTNPNSWDRFKDAIHTGWAKVTGEGARASTREDFAYADDPSPEPDATAAPDREYATYNDDSSHELFENREERGL